MQPLAYFAVRGLLGWLQFVERDQHAFTSNALLLVATGAAHCWAVVYALFIAIHTRAMRYDGYHEGYTEHLPFWVSWTETLAVGAMGVWWAAGFTTAAIRIIDDDARDLPVNGQDVSVNIFRKIMRSQRLHDALAIAHALSCAGLFLSILLLCVAMALMKGAVTACELCLCFVSIGFALPHAVVAGRRLQTHTVNAKKVDDTVMQDPAPAAEAAAQEAAALGPQLCVILALADSPGHAYLWQNFAYLLSAVAFVAAVAACGRSPPKVGDAALPPETGEVATCLVLDVVAALSLVVCFPHLNTWHLWALTALLLAVFLAIWFEGWRDLFIDLLDPLLVVRSDMDKALPGQQRQRMRRAAWGTTLVCAGVALWDILLHPIQEGLFEPMEAHEYDGDLPDIWSQSTMMLLRWKPPPTTAPGEELLLSAASEALGLEENKLATQAMFPNHRLLLFRYVGGLDNSSKIPMHMRWKAAIMAPKGNLGDIADSDFPGVLNVTLCLQAHLVHELAKQDTAAQSEKAESAAEGAGESEPPQTEPKPRLPPDFLGIVGPSEDAHAAYLAGCDWWTDMLESHYGVHNETDDEVADGEALPDSREVPHGEDGDDIAVD